MAAEVQARQDIIALTRSAASGVKELLENVSKREILARKDPKSPTVNKPAKSAASAPKRSLPKPRKPVSSKVKSPLKTIHQTSKLRKAAKVSQVKNITLKQRLSKHRPSSSDVQVIDLSPLKLEKAESQAPEKAKTVPPSNPKIEELFGVETPVPSPSTSFEEELLAEKVDEITLLVSEDSPPQKLSTENGIPSELPKVDCSLPKAAETSSKPKTSSKSTIGKVVYREEADNCFIRKRNKTKVIAPLPSNGLQEPKEPSTDEPMEF